MIQQSVAVLMSHRVQSVVHSRQSFTRRQTRVNSPVNISRQSAALTPCRAVLTQTHASPQTVKSTSTFLRFIANSPTSQLAETDVKKPTIKLAHCELSWVSAQTRAASVVRKGSVSRSVNKCSRRQDDLIFS